MSRDTRNGMAPARVDHRLRERLRAKWQQVPRQYAWGDRIDARFAMAARLGALRGRRVLDVGCNAGVLLSEADASNWKVGLDLDDRALAVARQQFPGPAYIRADMHRLPFPDGAFDTVICCGMVEVPPSQAKASLIKEVARVLQPQGHLFLTTPNRRNLHYQIRTIPAVSYDELGALLAPHFEYRIWGFNPFPAFPRFVPNRCLAATPGIWSVLHFSMARGINRTHCGAFYVEATRR